MIRYPARELWIALTDQFWFDFLYGKARANGGTLDEVNFWQPKMLTPIKRLNPGEPFFFRLKSPINAIAGYGFFAHFRADDIEEAWRAFGWKNGDGDRVSFLRRIGDYRAVDLLAPRGERARFGCNVLVDATFWPREKWIPWGEEQGWARSGIQTGRTERDPARVEMLNAALKEDRAKAPLIPEELDDRFRLVEVDERSASPGVVYPRLGQGSFRLRLLDAYGQCAITGEHTEPVLDAAHIQPYMGARSNHVQNGLLLTKEFHTLFDRGYVGVTPDLKVHISPRLREDWNNGRRYEDYDGRPLKQVPKSPSLRPSLEALDWHYRNRFMRTG